MTIISKSRRERVKRGSFSCDILSQFILKGVSLDCQHITLDRVVNIPCILQNWGNPVFIFFRKVNTKCCENIKHSVASDYSYPARNIISQISLSFFPSQNFQQKSSSISISCLHNPVRLFFSLSVAIEVRKQNNLRRVSKREGVKKRENALAGNHEIYEENSQAIVAIAIPSDILVQESSSDSFFYHSFTTLLKRSH